MSTPFVFTKATSPEGLVPIRQVSGVCFDDTGRILLLRQLHEPGKQWNIPGGHPEEGETWEEVLKREVYEETTVVIGACAMIGYQAPIDPKNEPYYQLRYAARVERIDPPAIDPAKGVIHERLFVEPERVMEYIVFPQYREMFAAAVEWFQQTAR